MFRCKEQVIDKPHRHFDARVQHGIGEAVWDRHFPGDSPRRGGRGENSQRISCNARALCPASWVRRLDKSAGVSSLRPARKSSARAIHNGSRSSRWPACSCAGPLPWGRTHHAIGRTAARDFLDARGSAAQTYSEIGIELDGKREFKLAAKPIGNLCHEYALSKVAPESEFRWQCMPSDEAIENVRVMVRTPDRCHLKRVSFLIYRSAQGVDHENC